MDLEKTQMAIKMDQVVGPMVKDLMASILMVMDPMAKMVVTLAMEVVLVEIHLVMQI